MIEVGKLPTSIMNTLATINTKLISDLPLLEEENLLGNLIIQIAGQQIEAPYQCPDDISAKSPEIENLPASFKQVENNTQYVTYFDGKYLLCRHNITMFREHLAKILAHAKNDGYPDEEVGFFPSNGSFNDIIEWLESISRYLNMSITVWSSECPEDHCIIWKNPQRPVQIYYHNKQFYHVVMIHQ